MRETIISPVSATKWETLACEAAVEWGQNSIYNFKRRYDVTGL